MTPCIVLITACLAGTALGLAAAYVAHLRKPKPKTDIFWETGEAIPSVDERARVAVEGYAWGND